jgi:transcriptional regulator with XRE-family HTH domain
MPKSLHSEGHQIIATALAEQRRLKGMSQVQVTQAVGRHQPFIANIESGQRRVDLVELLELAMVIDLDVGALVQRIQALRARQSP